MDTQAFLNAVRAAPDYRDQIVHTVVIPARPARFADPVVSLDGRLRAVLAHEGIERFYTHQAVAIDTVCGPTPRDLVIVTGTASGKTLCYNVPVLNALLAKPDGRALYLFPTKALAQDQRGALDRLCAADPDLRRAVRASTYDGDTPQSRRRTARREANVILSNPDMLHANILPQHARWARERFFTHLAFVVLDEVHAYRGTFGSHVANVIRRLRRVCRHYGSDPVFICCSATIANPRQLVARLIGRAEDEIVLVNDDGSPRGRKFFVMWNPPFVDESGLERRSANIEAQRLMRDLILQGAQTITFARARVVAELVYKYVYEDLVKREPALARRVQPYRGGYLPNERRRIEQALFSGELLGVCSTNALELGIDVGTLDAAIIIGFPGTICSLWQQAGRAGRTQEESLAVFVAYNDPVDQYFLRHPDYFLAQSPEHAAIDPRNERILEAQLKCAAAEIPLACHDDDTFGCRVVETVQNYQKNCSDAQCWSIDANDCCRFHLQEGRLPHHSVNLRLIGNETFDIVDRTQGRRESIGNVDSISAPELVYPNAVYLHEGKDYLVRDLDFDAKIAYVELADVDYYTQAVLADHCRIVGTDCEDDCRGGRKHLGRLDVTWQTVAFKKIKYYTLEVIGQDGLNLPPQTIHTIGLWATFPPGLPGELQAAGYRTIEGMVGVRNLLLVTLPMLAMCDRRDISGCIESAGPGRLMMVVYDRYPGGIGYARLGYEHFSELLLVCRELVKDCPCAAGCPSCVGLANIRPPLHGDPDIGGGYSIPNKAATILALERWLG